MWGQKKGMTKRIFIASMIALLCVMQSRAKEIKADEALARALSEMKYETQTRAAVGDYKLVRSEDHLYVFSTGKGFLLASADTRANAILGYTDNGTFDQVLLNPAFSEWLDQCKSALKWISEQPESDEPVVQEKMTTRSESFPKVVMPLLGSIAWDQSDPFNKYCPVVPKGNVGEGKLCYTGCVATALAQIMKYYEWPKRGTGTVSYTAENLGIKLSADLSQSNYKWDQMIPGYGGSYTDEQAKSVARLISDIGIACKMEYGGDGSGAFDQDAMFAVANNFSYNKGLKLRERFYYSTEEWNDMMKSELSQSRPLYYGGVTPKNYAGHAFVIDGYDSKGLYHVNWGWGGSGNGYYDINYLNPNGLKKDSSEGYSYYQSFFADLVPDKDGTSVATCEMVAWYYIFNGEKISFAFDLDNKGLKPYSGKAGVAAYQNGEVIASALEDVEDIVGFKQHKFDIPLSELGIDVDKLGNDTCQVYPVYEVGGELVQLKNFSAMSPFYNVYVDGDDLVIEPDAANEPDFECLDFKKNKGSDVDEDILISGKVANNAPHEYNLMVYLEVLDEDGESVFEAFDMAYLKNGESKTVKFVIPANTLEKGKKYSLYLGYEYGGYLFYFSDAITLEFPKEEGSVSISPIFDDSRSQDAKSVSFDLMGRPVKLLQSGKFYIHDGKKVVR